MLGSCYTQKPPKLHGPSFLTHHAASSLFAARYHPISLGFPSIPFPYFCYNCLPMSRSNLHPALLREQRKRAAQAWGNSKALGSSICSSAPPDLGPLASLSPCSPVVRCTKAILAFRSYKAQFTVGLQSAGNAAWKGQGLQDRFP